MKKNYEDLKPLENKVWLSSPTMHGEEVQFVLEAVETNWVSTVGANINELEKQVAAYVGMEYAVALASGTAALHMCMKLAGEKVNPHAKPGAALAGQKVFCSDLTFAATVNPIVYECGEPVFIDAERDTWNMDPVALERAFAQYPETKIVVLAHLYGVPAKMDEIMAICRKHGALLVEDAAEAMGAEYGGSVVSGGCGSFGDYCALSFNGNKIITGSSGGMFLTNCREDADKVRKWSTQSRENAPWYQHEELGYNYRMSNIVAGVLRGNLLHIDEHIADKKAIYLRYQEGMKDLPVKMNPCPENMEANYWLSCMTIDPEGMCHQERGDLTASYTTEEGKSCPTEILELLAAYNAEGRPLWKPMHLQPIYSSCGFVTANPGENVGADLFARGLCLPSDNKMTPEQQDLIIELIRRCF